MSVNRGHLEPEPNYIWKRKVSVVTEILRGHLERYETNYIWKRKVSVVTETLQHSQKSLCFPATKCATTREATALVGLVVFS